MNVKSSPPLPGLRLIGGSLRLNPHFKDALVIDQLGAEAWRLAEQLMLADPTVEQTLRSRGETNADRIAEYLQVQRSDGSYINDGPVIGLHEGGMLRVAGNTMTLTGVAGAKVFLRAASPIAYEPGADLSFLLS